MTSRNSRALRRCQLTTAILSTLLLSGVAFAQDNTSISGAQQGQEEN